MVRLEDVATITKGVTYSKKEQMLSETNTVILTADNITLDGYLTIKKKVFLDENYQISQEKKLIKNDIFMCFSSGSKKHLGKVAFINVDTNYYAGGFMGIVRAKNNVLAKYVFQLLNGTFRQTIRNTGSGSNINNLSSIINDIKLPLPPLSVQQEIVSEIEKLEQQEEQAKNEIEKLKAEIGEVIEKTSTEKYKLGEIISLEYGISLPEKSRILGDYPVVGSNGIIGFHNDFLITAPTIIVGRKGSAGKINWIDRNCTPIDTTFYVKLIKPFSMKIIYYTLLKCNLEKLSAGISMPGLNRETAYSQTIFSPPLSVQEKIVSEIEVLEARILELEKELKEIPKKKEKILKAYL